MGLPYFFEDTMSLGTKVWEKTHPSQVAKEKKVVESVDLQKGMTNQNAPAGGTKNIFKERLNEDKYE